MSDVSSLGALTAFAAGIVSFLSPCVLPLVPGYLAYVTGHSTNRAAQSATVHGRLSELGLSTLFVLGFSTVFIALGASATTLGRLLLAYRYEANLVGGALIVLFGLFMTGLVKFPGLQRDLRFHAQIPGGRPLGAYGLGLAFGAGWTPCIGPVLGAILTMSAVSSNTETGIVLLSAYALGLGIPFLASALFAGGLVRRIKTLRRTGRALQIGAGAILIVMGTTVMSGQLSAFSYWLLQTFPVLATIG